MPSLFISALRNWRERPDEALLHLVFAGLLCLTAAMLAQDAQRFAAELDGGTRPAVRRNVPDDVPATPLSPARPGTEHDVPASDTALREPMSFELRADGRLYATGSIVSGTAAAFAAEVEKRGSYVRTVVLHSPGGSVQDALAMGRLIRAKGFGTEVAAGAYCASSCPLTFSGGAERRVGAKGALGVHQVYSADRPAGRTRPDGMDSAQRISAECQRYLRDMGVDQEVWLHAMETPKEKLFYFTPEEMRRLKLTTA